MSGKKLFSTAALLEKSDSYRIINAYSVSDNEDEAKGKLVATVFEKYGGYRIADLLCMEVPEDVIASVSSISKAPTKDKAE